MFYLFGDKHKKSGCSFQRFYSVAIDVECAPSSHTRAPIEGRGRNPAHVVTTN